MYVFSAMIQTKAVPCVSLKTARIGDNVTLHCGAAKESTNVLYWYKQSMGYIPQMVAAIVYKKGQIFPPFNLSLTTEEPDMDLNIRSVSKGDEANYFCQEHYSKTWIGIFLSVKGIRYIPYLFSILS